MKTSYKITAVTLPVAIASFMLGRVIWPDPSGMPGPDATLLPHFIFISALESIAFGIGIAFLIFGWPLVAKGAKDKLTVASFISVLWYLISWWPHDNMHRTNAMDDFAGLLRIEYIFHFTLIIAGMILAAYLWRELRDFPHSSE